LESFYGGRVASQFDVQDLPHPHWLPD